VDRRLVDESQASGIPPGDPRGIVRDGDAGRSHPVLAAARLDIERTSRPLRVRRRREDEAECKAEDDRGERTTHVEAPGWKIPGDRAWYRTEVIPRKSTGSSENPFPG